MKSRFASTAIHSGSRARGWIDAACRSAAIALALASAPASAAWYDNPSIVKKVPVAQNVPTHPHFINKSADDSLLLVNLNSSDDNAAPVLLIDMASLADRSVAADEVAMSRPVSKPSEGFGSGWKGGAISAKPGLALMGGGYSSETCAIATDGETWTKGSGLKPLSTSNGWRIDGLDFSADSQYLYSNFYADSTGGDTGQGKLLRWTYNASTGKLVLDREFATSLTRIRNISVHTVNGRELVYCGEGGGAAAKVVAIDVSGDTWTEHVVSSGIEGLTGNITNVKLSNEDDANPVMYVLGKDGKLAVCKLAADGLSVAGTLRTFTSAEMLALAGGLSGEDEFVNFEVAKDGKTAFLIKRIDTKNANLCVLATSAYIESDGTQAINSGYYINADTKIEIDCQLTEVVSQARLFGQDGSGCGNTAVLYFGDTANNFKFGYGNTFNGVFLAANNLLRNTIVYDGPNNRGYMIRDGVEVASASLTAAHNARANFPMGIFAACTKADGTTFNNFAKMRLYGLRIYETGKLVHDYTPAVKDGVAGLLDSATGIFLCDTRATNAGTFAYGGDIETIDDDPYVESDGTGAINTGIVAQPGLKIELDYAFTTITTGDNGDYQQRLFGQDSIGSTPRISVYINASKNVSIATGDGWDAKPTGIGADSLRRKVVIDNPAGVRAFMTGVTTNWTDTTTDITKCATRPLGLFGNPKDDAATQFKQRAMAKVYGLKIWSSGTLVRDLAPRLIDGTAGFEDLVTGKFYTCGGLAASANAPTALSGRSGDGDGFIESDGSLYSSIDTRYFPSGKTKVEVDFQFVRNAASKDCLLGNYGSTYTVLVYAPNGGNFNLEAKDSGHATLSFANAVKSDTARHTAVIDAPKTHAALYDANGALQGEADFPDSWTHKNTANWPLTLFGSSTNAWGKTRQNAVARIFGVKISESSDNGATYTPVHTFTPCVKGGIPGFYDKVTGKFISGGNLIAGGNVMEIDDDPYVASPEGGCFFDTGFYATSNTCVVCDFMLLEQRTNQQFPFEAGAAADGKSFMRMYGNGSAGTGDFAYALGQDNFKSLEVYYSPTARRQITLDAYNCKAAVAVNGHTIREMSTAASGRQPEQSTGTLKIFSNSAMNANSCRARLYGFKIYEEGRLVHDYVPICQGGTYALVDKVTGKVLEKASGSAAFDGSTANDSLDDSFFDAPMRDEDAYIESDGTQAINLGYFTTPDTRYEIDYQMTAIVGQMRPFGEATSTLSAELYIQDTGNVAFGVGDSWKGQYTNTGADLNRHVAVLDLVNRECGYSGYKLFAFDAATVCTRTATYPMWLFAKGTNANGAYNNRAKMKLYAFRIYEAGELVHEYLPYKNGETVGLYDTVTGGVKLNSVNGANAFAYGGGMGYDKFAGVKTALTTEPADVFVKSRRTATLTAFAPGAVRYIWTRNGSVLAGADSSALEIVWEKPKTAGTPIYGVTPVFVKDGVEVRGAEATAEATMLPSGMTLVLR